MLLDAINNLTPRNHRILMGAVIAVGIAGMIGSCVYLGLKADSLCWHGNQWQQWSEVHSTALYVSTFGVLCPSAMTFFGGGLLLGTTYAFRADTSSPSSKETTTAKVIETRHSINFN